MIQHNVKKNIRLYYNILFERAGLFSILFAVIGAAVKDGDRIYTLGFFHGFGPLTWFIAVIQVIQNMIKNIIQTDSIVIYKGCGRCDRRRNHEIC